MSRTASPGLLAGIDVSLKELTIACKNRKGEVTEFTCPNTVVGHRRLADLFGNKRRASRIVVEATGTFHLDLALHLVGVPGIHVMIVNPLAARRFAQAQMRRAKTDRVDARMLLEFAERMEFVGWAAPRAAVLELRALGRHLSRLVAERTATMNQIAAMSATAATPAFVLDDLRAGVAQTEARLAACQAEALRVIATDPALLAGHQAMLTVKGIGDRTAVLLASELAVLDPAMKPDEVVAHAGLDPRPHQSGTLDGARRTSKVGNARLRGTLFMPSTVAARYNAPVREWHDQLIARGKPPMVAYTAVARRLLRAIWVIHTKRISWKTTCFALARGRRAQRCRHPP
jgi:transposase